MARKYKQTTAYDGIKSIYFHQILKKIISIGGLKYRNLRVLDFGSGYGELKKMLPGVEVINFDIVKELSDVNDWKSVSFDIVVVNEVFYLFDEFEIFQFLNDLYTINNNTELIVGISRQSWLNNFGKIILGQGDAHKGTKTPPLKEIKILKSMMDIIKHKSVYMLSDVYHLCFKNKEKV